MIKGVVLDVDGVIVGEKEGVNFPYPKLEVIEYLKSIEAKGIPVSLCTAKPHYSIAKIINDAGLHNLHITNGGGVVIDPINDVVLKTHFVKKEVVKEIIQFCFDRGTYVEIYSVKEYFAQLSQESELTKVHTDILQHKPRLVESLTEESDHHDIVKVMPVAKDLEDMKAINEGLNQQFGEQVVVSWGVHPIALPHRFGIVTAKGISKKQAALAIAQHQGILPSEMLGVGDSTTDWQFIGECGYAGAMGNATDELKELVKTKGENSFIGKIVDEDGILDIFKHFGL